MLHNKLCLVGVIGMIAAAIDGSMISRQLYVSTGQEPLVDKAKSTRTSS